MIYIGYTNMVVQFSFSTCENEKNKPRNITEIATLLLHQLTPCKHHMNFKICDKCC